MNTCALHASGILLSQQLFTGLILSIATNIFCFRQYDITKNGTNVGVLRFNEQVDKENVIPFFFGIERGKKALLEKIGSIPYSGYGKR